MTLIEAKISLNIQQNIQKTKKKLLDWNLLNKYMYSPEDIVNRVKRQSADQEKVFAMYVSHTIYKRLLKLKQKKTTKLTLKQIKKELQLAPKINYSFGQYMKRYLT